MTRDGDMAIRLGSTVIICADLELMTSFWAEALGLTLSSVTLGDDFRVLRGEHCNLSLQLSRTPVTARDQMHLDHYSDDQPLDLVGLVVAVQVEVHLIAGGHRRARQLQGQVAVFSPQHAEVVAERHR